jgi:methionyl-tRNA synthetase
MTKKFYITTPLYYVNDVPHIGHAYTSIAADVLARYHRLKGDDVFFLTGTDEHGQKIADAAIAQNLSPQQFTDQIVPRFIDAWEKLGIGFDAFIRTTDEAHKNVVKAAFKKLKDSGDIYKGEYEGWYCKSDETFWTESQLIEGKCPNPECRREVQKLKEESYFFKLSKFEKPLLEYYASHAHTVRPESRLNEVLAFIKQGLKDLSISRTSFSWGIPIPDDEKHVTYVWFEALMNYFSALGYLSPDDSKFKKYWPADIHLMGKEIVRFHAVIWPAMLMALDIPLPHMVFGHGWWTVEGEKMSKSKGNVVDPLKLIEKYGLDTVRFFLMKEVVLGNDGDFSEKNLVDRYETYLANSLGNMLSRTVTMVVKYFGGVAPQISAPHKDEQDEAVIARMNKLADYFEVGMGKVEINECLDEIFGILGQCNLYIDHKKPWTLAKENKLVELGNCLSVLLETLRLVNYFLIPFMPNTAEKIWKILKIDFKTDMALEFQSKWIGGTLEKPEPLFPRFTAP